MLSQMLSTPVSDNHPASGNRKTQEDSPNLIVTPIGCDVSIISAQKTAVADSSTTKSKCRAKLEIFPSRLLFDSDLSDPPPSMFNSETMDVDVDSRSGQSGPGLSILRDMHGVRHLDEDPMLPQTWDNWQQRYNPTNFIDEKSNTTSAEIDINMEDCFTPTAAASLPGQQNASLIPLLARPTKKVNVHSVTEPRKQNNLPDHSHSTIMDREDFTKLLRQASDLDYHAHYEYIELLGQGQFGEVWSVRHKRYGSANSKV